MMRLSDRVDVLRAGEIEDPYDGTVTPTWDTGVTSTTVRAYVGSSAVAIVSTPDQPGRVALSEQLRAVLEPITYDPVWNRLRWRGQTYTNDGPPMVRRLRGKDHHLTIPLKLVTG